MASNTGQCSSCGEKVAPLEEPPEAWVGRTIDQKYEILGVLGVGGMGMVFEARRLLVGDHVALKVLFPRLLSSRLQRDLFHDEGIAAARLSHKNVVTVFDADLSASTGTAYIAMELLRGDTLKTLLRERAPMSPEEIIPILIEVCEGLEAAHRAQIIHRDLKPDNIFLEESPGGRRRVKLVDFGIAAMLDAERRTNKRQRLGTLRYMAPEQCRGEQIDPRADLYALGVVLYEALTRRRATGKTVSAVCFDVPELPNIILDAKRQIPHRLEDLVMMLLSKEATGRPSSALRVKELINWSLEEYRGGKLPKKAFRPLGASTPQDSRTRSILAFGVMSFIGVMGGILWGVLS